MRKLIVWNMMTLDGFFEGPDPWEFDWHEYAGVRAHDLPGLCGHHGRTRYMRTL